MKTTPISNKSKSCYHTTFVFSTELNKSSFEESASVLLVIKPDGNAYSFFYGVTKH
jgi:hypothetical protein